MCQVFLDIALVPIFSALHFCTLFSGYRAVAWWPNAVEWAAYKLIDPCFAPIDGRVT